MIIYSVLGSAPIYMGRCVYDAGVGEGLISFYDYPKAYTSLGQVDRDILQKLADRHNPPKEQSHEDI